MVRKYWKRFLHQRETGQEINIDGHVEGIKYDLSFIVGSMSGNNLNKNRTIIQT